MKTKNDLDEKTWKKIQFMNNILGHPKLMNMLDIQILDAVLYATTIDLLRNDDLVQNSLLNQLLIGLNDIYKKCVADKKKIQSKMKDDYVNKRATLNDLLTLDNIFKHIPYEHN